MFSVLGAEARRLMLPGPVVAAAHCKTHQKLEIFGNFVASRSAGPFVGRHFLLERQFAGEMISVGKARRCPLKGHCHGEALGTRPWRNLPTVDLSFFIALDLFNPWTSDLETHTNAFFFIWASCGYVFFSIFFSLKKKNMSWIGVVPAICACPRSSVFAEAVDFGSSWNTSSG